MPIHLLPSAVGARTRREFLAGLAAAGSALAMGSIARGRARGDGPGWFALVSDTHIAADPASRNRGQCMADNLRAVVADILAQEDAPRGVVIDGDLALKDGQPGDYSRFANLLGPLRDARLPLHLTLGNHDDRTHFRAALKAEPPADATVVDKHVGVVGGGAVRFVLLDSLEKVDGTPGLLGERQLTWLAATLDADQKAPTLVFVHHNPSDKPGALTDTEALMRVLRPRRQVKALVYGHSHRWERAQDDGIHLVNLPAVAYTFADDQPLGWCRLRPGEDGAELELRCIGGDKSKDGQRVPLRWRGA
jgi:3',5'-cyclic AMP phosphodiesterase CpdA